MFGKKLLRSVTASWLGILLLTSIDCKISKEDIPGRNPVPVLSSISPSAQVAHMPSFTLAVTGSDFVRDSKILFNGIERASEYISPGELTCRIDPDDLPAGAACQYTGTRDTGSADSTVPVLAGEKIRPAPFPPG
jgi:hypothetical protein